MTSVEDLFDRANIQLLRCNNARDTRYSRRLLLITLLRGDEGDRNHRKEVLRKIDNKDYLARKGVGGSSDGSKIFFKCASSGCE